MWRTSLLVAGMSLAAVTPGAALLAVQQWGPVILAIAALAGSALAVGAAAYRKATANARQLEKLARHIPKRSTDGPTVTPPTGAIVTPGGTTPGDDVARTAISQQEGDIR